MVLLAPHHQAQATNVGDSLIIGIQSVKTLAIEPLDPVERDVMSVYNLVYESLVTIDDDYLPQPLLAESWEMSGGGKTWTFHLRSNVFFSDGTPMTAQDVVATAQYILQRANDEASHLPGYYANLKYFVSKISASDEKTVVVKTASGRSYYGLLYAMTFPVLPASQVNVQNPLGTGPYVFSAFEAGSHMYLTVNPHWWQNPPQVKELMFTCYNTQSKVIQAYEYAQVETIFTRTISASQYKSGTSSLALDYRTNQLETVLLNHSAFPLDSLAIRKAIRLLIDPDKIASSVYMGMVERTDTPMIAGTWMYNDNLSSYFTTNAAEAARILAEEGWADTNDDGVLDKLGSDGKPANLHLRFYVYEEPENNVRVEAANMIADALAQVGIETKIEMMTMEKMKQKLSAGAFDLALCSFAMDVCPDPGFLLMKNNTGNYCRYKSEKMTDLCKELRTQTTQEGYRQTLMDIQQQFAEDCPFICLFYRAGSVLTRRMYTVARDVRELELLRGIQTFHP